MTSHPIESIQKHWLMTPGPTEVSTNVRFALAQSYTNPDLDPQFVAFYSETAKLLNDFIHNDGGETFLLAGEGILGLEAACASFIEPNDAVLIIENGIFGEGFNDFATMYGAKTTVYSSDRKSGLSPEAIDSFIKEHGPFKYATIVHCETPSGITNPIEAIGPILKRHGILSIVDSVSAIGGEKMDMVGYGLDVVLCASQKVFSAPVGLTSVSLSEKALLHLKQRQTPIVGFYTNLKHFLNYREEKWFAYTQPIHLIAAFRVALEQIDASNSVLKHLNIANAVRQALTSSGLSLYAESDFANTVTTVCLPKGVDFDDLQAELSRLGGVLVGGGFGFLANQIFRIGHMGEGADPAKLKRLFAALDQAFMHLGSPLEDSLSNQFSKYISTVETTNF